MVVVRARDGGSAKASAVLKVASEGLRTPKLKFRTPSQDRGPFCHRREVIVHKPCSLI